MTLNRFVLFAGSSTPEREGRNQGADGPPQQLAQGLRGHGGCGQHPSRHFGRKGRIQGQGGRRQLHAVDPARLQRAQELGFQERPERDGVRRKGGVWLLGPKYLS